jgi:hypothetical protein
LARGELALAHELGAEAMETLSRFGHDRYVHWHIRGLLAEVTSLRGDPLANEMFDEAMAHLKSPASAHRSL